MHKQISFEVGLLNLVSCDSNLFLELVCCLELEVAWFIVWSSLFAEKMSTAVRDPALEELYGIFQSSPSLKGEFNSLLIRLKRRFVQYLGCRPTSLSNLKFLFISAGK